MDEEKYRDKGHHVDGKKGIFESKHFTLHQRHAWSGVCLQSLASTEPAEDGHRAAEQSS